MFDVRADQTCIWKCLLQDGKPLTKHMLTCDLLDPYEQISVKCLLHILVMQWPSFCRCYFQMYCLSLKLWCLRFESWMTFVPRGTIFYKSTLVWKMACHRFSDKPLSKRVLTSPLPLKMTCVWRRPKYFVRAKNLIKIQPQTFPIISIYFKRKTWNNIDRKDRQRGVTWS